jgi:hypothetical protein
VNTSALDSDLAQVLWANWADWAKGGLDEQVIEARLGKDEQRFLTDWFRDNSGAAAIPSSIKQIVDTASWCLYGIHTLSEYPPEIRRSTTTRTAHALDIPMNSLQRLISASSALPEID